MAVSIDENAREYKHFVNSLRSIHTKDAYECGLVDFMEYARIETLQDFIALDKKELQDRIIDFVVERRKKLAYASVATKLSGILRFCEMADIEINRRKVKSFSGECRRTVRDRIYTKEELQILLQNSGIRTRVLILLLVSTGMRIEEKEGPEDKLRAQ